MRANPNSNTTIAARQLLAPEGLLDWPLVTIDDGRIMAVQLLEPREHERVDASYRFPDGVLAPAYLDLHLHGCAGEDVMRPTPEGMRTIGACLAGHGVGAYLPTTVTSPQDETMYALSCLAREIGEAERRPAGEQGGARPLGIHLEGPFLSERKRGVHTAALLQAPSVAAFDRLWQAAEGRILLLTIAPELPGTPEVIRHATALGVRCSLGHSDATFAEAETGFRAGARSATHTFNAMRRLDHRDPGLTAFVLDQEELYAEIIADGWHVDPAMVRLFLKAKGPERAILVTDGMSATDMPDGEYKLGDMEVQVVGGRCTHDGAIAGSTLTLDRGVRNLMQFTGAPLATAVGAASRNPAGLLGVGHQWGELAVGRAAHLTVLSPAGEVQATFLEGHPAPLG